MRRMIKILVDDFEQAREILDVLEEHEANGNLDFPFTARITDPMTPSQAKHNLYNEVD